MFNKQFKKQQKKALKNTIEEDDQLSYGSIDDDQYFSLLQGNAPTKRGEVQLDSKYSGKKKQIDEEEESIKSDDFSDVEQTKTITKKNTKTNGNNKLHTELLQIEQEDLEIAEKQQQNTQELIETAATIKEQLHIWSNLVEIRQQYQKSIDIIKKLPIHPSEFHQSISHLNALKPLNHHLLDNIRNLKEIHNTLYSFEDTIDLSHFNMGLYGQLKEYYQGSNDAIEQDIIKWSQKTAMLQNLNKRNGLSSQTNFLMQTPIGQTQKALSNKDKILQKVQLKRSIFRILGEQASDLNEVQNIHIYDDTDFYLDLLKETITTNYNEEQEMLQKDTEQYILKRQAQRQEKEAKVIDRRASKCRKIRYEPHQKLINFMAKVDELPETLPREDILRNLFGNEEPRVQKKRKLTQQDMEINLL